jgi:formiminoglutamase
MKLPLLISVPHAGVEIPDEVKDICILSRKNIVEDGDVGASEIYDFGDNFEHYFITKIARAIVDLNRAEDDFRKDGIIKTHTCWDMPVYSKFPSATLINKLIETCWRPYHTNLTANANKNAILGIDCHTMASIGPPVGPDHGNPRPWICLSNGDGETCPDDWMERLRLCFEKEFGPRNVAVNDPFKGGYITRTHGKEMPWVQLEVSRGNFFPNHQKRERILSALNSWCAQFP